jgi:hypothetical protein
MRGRRPWVAVARLSVDDQLPLFSICSMVPRFRKLAHREMKTSI